MDNNRVDGAPVRPSLVCGPAPQLTDAARRRASWQALPEPAPSLRGVSDRKGCQGPGEAGGSLHRAALEPAQPLTRSRPRPSRARSPSEKSLDALRLTCWRVDTIL